jgi:hypothetical protein
MAVKKVVPKKKVAKKKTTKKKAPAKRGKAGAGKLTLKAREALVTKIVAILWAEFVKAAQLPVDDGCFDEAIALGALKNVRKDIQKFSNVRQVNYQILKICSIQAGNRAKRLARQKNAPNITKAIYREAFNSVKNGVNAWTTQKGQGVIHPFGPLCAPA